MCTSSSVTIVHGQVCDLTCDVGFEVRAQPSCDDGRLTSSTATCSAGTSFDMEPQMSDSVELQTRVDSILSEAQIRDALVSQGVEVVAVSVIQEIEVSLQELLGEPEEYSDSPDCTPCKIKR